MSKRIRYPVNDISHCVEQASRLTKRRQKKRRRDVSIFRAFASLAGDETIGFLAYAIWRGRSQLLSQIHTASIQQTAGAERGNQ